MWKTRTRTKIVVIALIWIGLLITFLVVGLPLLGLKYPQLIDYRENISAIIVSLTMGGAGMFIFHVVTVSRENLKGKLREISEAVIKPEPPAAGNDEMKG